MIKKVIFDLDNTLIMFKKEYIESYKVALEKSGYEATYEDAYNIFESIGRYEQTQKSLDKQKLLDFINKDLNKNYSLSFVDNSIEAVTDGWIHPVSKELIDLLEYLSSKYELYVLTNFFTDCQAKRLKNVGIDSYFKEIVGADIVKMKPSKEAFTYFIDEDSSECIMIGDNTNTDIKGAIEVGMQVILFDYKNMYSDLPYQRVTNYTEIKDIL